MHQIDVADALLFVTPLAVSTLALTAMHFYPWHRGARPLRRVDAYALGTLVTVGVPVVTMLLAALLTMRHSELFWAALLVVNALVSGATVNLCYVIDAGRALGLEDVSDARH